MKNKKILIIFGSPRKNGNCATLCNNLKKGITENRGEFEFINLHKLNISPCNACDACIRDPEKGCVIDDDMISLYPKIEEAEIIVFASPIYWFNISAQLKLFIDRTYAIQKDGKYAFTNKKVAIILTYGDSDIFNSGGVNALRSFQDICSFVGAKIVGIIHGSANKPGEIKDNKTLMDEAYKLGKKLSQK